MTIDELLEDSPFTFRDRDAREAQAKMPRPVEPTEEELVQADEERFKKKVKDIISRTLNRKH